MQRNILFLSGAGLSAPSGIKTFRDTDGLWENYDVMEVCSVEGFAKNRQKVMDFYKARRKDIKDKFPNEAHFMISRVRERYAEKVSILTQNVDDLLERADCKEVIHLHGTLTDMRCENCKEVFFIGYETPQNPTCPSCKSDKIRHNVVMFGESAPMYRVLFSELEKANLLICIGTSGQVLDVATFAKFCPYSILNNLDKEPKLDDAFTLCFHESAEKAAEKIEKICDNFIENGII